MYASQVEQPENKDDFESSDNAKEVHGVQGIIVHNYYVFSDHSV